MDHILRSYSVEATRTRAALVFLPGLPAAVRDFPFSVAVVCRACSAIPPIDKDPVSHSPIHCPTMWQLPSYSPSDIAIKRDPLHL